MAINYSKELAITQTQYSQFMIGTKQDGKLRVCIGTAEKAGDTILAVLGVDGMIFSPLMSGIDKAGADVAISIVALDKWDEVLGTPIDVDGTAIKYFVPVHDQVSTNPSTGEMILVGALPVGEMDVKPAKIALIVKGATAGDMYAIYYTIAA